MNKLTKSEILKQIGYIQANGDKLVANGVIIYTLGDNQVVFNPKTNAFTLTYNGQVYP